MLSRFKAHGNYPFSNIYLFVEVEYPNGKTRIDTINEVLADSRGIGMDQVWEIWLITELDIKLELNSLEGLYKINITHGMRLDPLEELTDLGLRLEDVSL